MNKIILLIAAFFCGTSLCASDNFLSTEVRVVSPVDGSLQAVLKNAADKGIYLRVTRFQAINECSLHLLLNFCYEHSELERAKAKVAIMTVRQLYDMQKMSYIPSS